VQKDEMEAVKWYRQAAEQNNDVAQNTLGDCYFQGHGVVKDEVEGVMWYRKAAEQNFAPAQCNLGVCCRDGRGVQKDEVEAVKWFRKAAEQGDAVGQVGLGGCYVKAQGVAKDAVEAYKWYLLAAAQGHEIAKHNAGYAESQLTPEQRAEGQKRASEFKPLGVASAGVEQGAVITAIHRPISSPRRKPATPRPKMN
jgi:TPR repeat protein